MIPGCPDSAALQLSSMEPIVYYLRTALMYYYEPCHDKSVSVCHSFVSYSGLLFRQTAYELFLC